MLFFVWNMVRQDFRMVTMGEVASAAGVDKSTVSRALSGKGNISPDVRARILDVCEKLGYRLNSNIQDLVLASRTGNARTLAYVLVNRHFSTRAYSVFLDHLSDPISRAGYHVILVKLRGDERRFYDFPGILTETRLAGIFLSGELNAGVCGIIRDAGIPCVALGDYSEDVLGGLPCARGDVRGLFRRAIAELKDAVGTRLAYVGSDHRYFHDETVWSAYRWAMAENGLPVDRDRCYFFDSDGDILFQGLRGLYADPAPLPFDAVFCHNPYLLPQLSNLAYLRYALTGAFDAAIVTDVKPEFGGLPPNTRYTGGMDMPRIAQSAFDTMESLLRGQTRTGVTTIVQA